MQDEAIHTDISEDSELLYLARKVQRTGVSRVLHAGDEAIAVLNPALERSTLWSVPPPAGSFDGLLALDGMFEGDEADDVSQNVDKYLAQANFEELSPPEGN